MSGCDFLAICHGAISTSSLIVALNQYTCKDIAVLITSYLHMCEICHRKMGYTFAVGHMKFSTSPYRYTQDRYLCSMNCLLRLQKGLRYHSATAMMFFNPAARRLERHITYLFDNRTYRIHNKGMNHIKPIHPNEVIDTLMYSLAPNINLFLASLIVDMLSRCCHCKQNVGHDFKMIPEKGIYDIHSICYARRQSTESYCSMQCLHDYQMSICSKPKHNVKWHEIMFYHSGPPSTAHIFLYMVYTVKDDLPINFMQNIICK